jgi:hypothetical protein
LQPFAQYLILSAELFEFVILGHAVTLADSLSFRNCIAHLNTHKKSSIKQFVLFLQGR